MLIYAASLVSSCSTMTRSLSLGAASGATAGTFVGAAIVRKDKPKSAVKGALVGGFLGAVASYFVHQGLKKRDEKTRKTLLFNLESFGITEPKKTESGDNPTLTKPVVDSQWVETRIEGNKLIQGHKVWIIKENPKWIPMGQTQEDAQEQPQTKED